MAKLAPTSTKYTIRAKIKAKGVIEKPDVIGAVFGQTEGLLGMDLDLRELQKTGRIGRIEVTLKSVMGNSEGEIEIPSSLDAAETALIAATLETIERIGPCTAEIKLISVEDARESKRKYVIDKAKEILQNMMEGTGPTADELSEKLKENVRVGEVKNYHGLPCGPGLMEGDAIVVVEGRADVVNLLKFGIRNTVAVEGTSIPQPVVDLAKQKSVTLLVDGDRGGLAIVREMMAKTEIDYVAQAPAGMEIEELSKKEVFKLLRDKVSSEQFRSEVIEKGNGLPERKARDARRTRTEREATVVTAPTVELTEEQVELFKRTLDELVGTRAACIFTEDNTLLGRVPLSELANALETLENPYAVVIDGKVDYTTSSVAKTKGARLVIGTEKDHFTSSIPILDRADLDAIKLRE